MARTTEHEIIECLKENLRLAAENADRLARHERGPVYVDLRRQLKLVEGACRQMAGWREDARWLPFGVKVGDARLRCGKWLRERQPEWRFRGLAEILRFAHTQALDLERKRTGRVGILLPPVQPAPIRTEGRSILVPSSYADIRNREALPDIEYHRVETVMSYQAPEGDVPYEQAKTIFGAVH